VETMGRDREGERSISMGEERERDGDTGMIERWAKDLRALRPRFARTRCMASIYHRFEENTHCGERQTQRLLQVAF
jgi:hypothetical protein